MLPARLRTFFLPACLGALVVLIATFQLQAALALSPCPLCFSQRLMLGGYALVCLLATLHAPASPGKRRYAGVALGCALAGALLAARHVWLQGADDAGHACPVPLARLFRQSWSEAARQLLFGSADCNSLAWSFLDLTLPEWSLLAFLLLATLPLGYLLASRIHTLAIRDLR